MTTHVTDTHSTFLFDKYNSIQMHTHTNKALQSSSYLKKSKHKLGSMIQRSYSTVRVVCCIVKSLYQHSCSQDGKVLAKLCQDKGNSRTKH